MSDFISDTFLLQSPEAERLYFDYAEDLPLLDYHCHLNPRQIATAHRFADITEAWLDGDHYKWRAMRANGIAEQFITGSASPREKFRAWARTVPYTLRNPLHHWTHLELKRYFGVTQLLSGNNADAVYDRCNEALSETKLNTNGILNKFKVEVVCTTDDPTASLDYHRMVARSGMATRMLPTFRPDKLFDTSFTNLSEYIVQLEASSNVNISSYQHLLEALEVRLDFFHEQGCCLSDHGLETVFSGPLNHQQASTWFAGFLQGKPTLGEEHDAFRSSLLLWLCQQYHRRGWVQQFHLGALRNTNRRKLRELGADTGYDSIGDWPLVKSLSAFLNELEEKGSLAKTIIYNLNPAQNEVIATLCGSFNDGSVAGKIQFGSGWWFLDQKDGIEKQINALSNMGLVSRFVGMLTDSRSFLSFPRHEYFRRVVCNLFAEDMRQGLIPRDFDYVGNILKGIAYTNAKDYFNFSKILKPASHES